MTVITITIDGKKYTFEEARELYTQLYKLFGAPQVITYPVTQQANPVPWLVPTCTSEPLSSAAD
jgi:hypothetical protein